MMGSRVRVTQAAPLLPVGNLPAPTRKHVNLQSALGSCLGPHRLSTDGSVGANPTASVLRSRAFPGSRGRRIHDWAATDLLGLTHLLIVEAGDSEQDIVEEVGFSPLESLDGVRFPAAGYVPPFDFAEQHDGWIELIQVVPNDPFAFVLLVDQADGADPELLQLCRAYAEGVPA